MGSAFLWVNPQGSAQAWLCGIFWRLVRSSSSTVSIYMIIFPHLQYDTRSALRGKPQHASQSIPRLFPLRSVQAPEGLFSNMLQIRVSVQWHVPGAPFVLLGYFSSSHTVPFILQLHNLLKTFSALPVSGTYKAFVSPHKAWKWTAWFPWRLSFQFLFYFGLHSMVNLEQGLLSWG